MGMMVIALEYLLCDDAKLSNNTFGYEVKLMLLEGKNVIITGAGRGIGKSVALACAKEGANLGLVSRTQEELQATKEEIEGLGTGVNVAPCTADVTNFEELKTAFEEIAGELGPINGVVANAGASSKKETHEFEPEEFARIMNTNVLGVFNTFKAAYPLLKKDDKKDKARFIITGSAAYPNAMPKFAAYTASKWAVAGFQKALSMEYASEAITFNIILPMMVDTRLSRGHKAGDGQKPETFMDPSDLDPYYLFFLSEEGNKASDMHVDVSEMEKVRKIIDEAPEEAKANYDAFKDYLAQVNASLAQNTRTAKKLIEFFLTR